MDVAVEPEAPAPDGRAKASARPIVSKTKVKKNFNPEWDSWDPDHRRMFLTELHQRYSTLRDFVMRRLKQLKKGLQTLEGDPEQELKMKEEAYRAILQERKEVMADLLPVENAGYTTAQKPVYSVDDVFTKELRTIKNDMQYIASHIISEEEHALMLERRRELYREADDDVHSRKAAAALLRKRKKATGKGMSEEQSQALLDALYERQQYKRALKKQANGIASERAQLEASMAFERQEQEVGDHNGLFVQMAASRPT